MNNNIASRFAPPRCRLEPPRSPCPLEAPLRVQSGSGGGSGLDLPSPHAPPRKRRGRDAPTSTTDNDSVNPATTDPSWNTSSNSFPEYYLYLKLLPRVLPVPQATRMAPCAGRQLPECRVEHYFVSARRDTLAFISPNAALRYRQKLDPMGSFEKPHYVAATNDQQPRWHRSSRRQPTQGRSAGPSAVMFVVMFVGSL